MKFAIQSKEDASSKKIKKQMEKYLQDFHIEMDEENPDIVVSIGGDGTLLQAFHRYQHRMSETAFVGVHTGHLGFYADWLSTEVEKLIIAIAGNPLEIVEYPLLEATICYHDDKKSRFIALNECTIKSNEGTLVLDVQMKDEHFETFRGDGLCVSTPTGSTAYNKALGGAIIHPTIEALQVTEMASINNRVFRTIGSPLILPNHHTCLIRPIGNTDFRVTLDHLSLDESNIKSIEFRVADEKVRFARFRPFPFWNRVRDAFVADEKNEN